MLDNFCLRNLEDITTLFSKINPKKLRELLTIAIIKDDLPFKFVEYKGTRPCV